jgi:hypothetical protein
MAGTRRPWAFLPLVGDDATEEDDVMFSVHCPRHRTEVLLPERHIRSMRNTDAGIEVDWVCFCGERGSFLTGRVRAGARTV